MMKRLRCSSIAQICTRGEFRAVTKCQSDDLVLVLEFNRRLQFLRSFYLSTIWIKSLRETGLCLFRESMKIFGLWDRRHKG